MVKCYIFAVHFGNHLIDKTALHALLRMGRTQHFGDECFHAFSGMFCSA